MKIEQPSDHSLYVTIGNFTYYFDDSIDSEFVVQRWREDMPIRYRDIEDIQIEDAELCQ